MWVAALGNHIVSDSKVFITVTWWWISHDKLQECSDNSGAGRSVGCRGGGGRSGLFWFIIWTNVCLMLSWVCNRGACCVRTQPGDDSQWSESQHCVAHGQCWSDREIWLTIAEIMVSSIRTTCGTFKTLHCWISTPEASESGYGIGTSKYAFQTTPRVTLILLTQGPQLENHWANVSNRVLCFSWFNLTLTKSNTMRLCLREFGDVLKATGPGTEKKGLRTVLVQEDQLVCHGSWLPPWSSEYIYCHPSKGDLGVTGESMFMGV